MAKEYIERDDALMGVMRAGCLANTVQVLKDIPAADVVEAKRWIPVTERLPEQSGWLLTFGQQRKTAVVYFSCDECWYDDDDYDIEVTHWMPMPQAPENGGNDGTA